MQRGNYAKKLEAMRAYYRTPAGQASSKRSRDKLKINCGNESKAMEINAQALFLITQNWTKS